MKKRIHEILTVSERKGDLSWWFDMFVIGLISANVIAVGRIGGTDKAQV